MPMKPRGSKKAAQFTESVIREMTRLAQRHQAVNLAQGFPDFPAPAAIKDAACRAILDDINQYAVTWGAPPLRQAIASRVLAPHGVPVVADEQVTVCCGATEAMMATLLAIVDPGDEVIVFEPFYENYGPDAILSGAVPLFVTLREPDWRSIPRNSPPRSTSGRARSSSTRRTTRPARSSRGTSSSPSPRSAGSGTCSPSPTRSTSTWSTTATRTSDGRAAGMAERTITISGLSKTFSVTGWRIGWTIAPPAMTGAIRKVHDFLTVGAPAPLQEAGAAALALPDSYYADLAAGYVRRRDMLLEILERHGFTCYKPSGAYYIMTDVSSFGFDDDVAFARHLVEHVGVAAVPGSSFYRDAARGRTKVRFCFSKRDETMQGADRRMTAKLREQ